MDETGDDGGLSRAATLNRLSTSHDIQVVVKALTFFFFLFIEGPDLDVQPTGALARSKTTINVPANARERIMAATSGADTSRSRSRSPRGNSPPAATVVARSNTAIATTRPIQAGLPTRGLSVRRPGPGDAPPATVSPKPSEQALYMRHLLRPYSSFLQKHLPGRRNSLRTS